MKSIIIELNRIRNFPLSKLSCFYNYRKYKSCATTRFDVLAYITGQVLLTDFNLLYRVLIKLCNINDADWKLIRR